MKLKKITLMLLLVLGGIFLFFTDIRAANPGDVLINEICWMGSQDSSSDEWVELYNSTGSNIDLTGWALVAEDGLPSIQLSGQIATNGYFLLERTDDASSPATADQIYSGALGNGGEYLQLFDIDSNIIHEVNGWTAGDNTQKFTMARQDNQSWANSISVGGTPRQANNQAVPPKEDQPPTLDYSQDYSDLVVVNEILPNPEDESLEWIEFKNLSDKSVDLNNWYLADSSGKIFIISSQNIPSQGFIVFDKADTKIALNNSGDIISLYNPAGDLVYSIEYTDSYENWSYARDEDNLWEWTTLLTRLEENQFDLPQSQTPQDTSSPGLTTSPSYSDNIFISEFLPNPQGSDSQEWIELYNNSHQEIDLTGWQIGDNSSRKYTLSPDDFSSIIIKANTYFILPRSATGIALNNSGGDELKLYQPDGSLVDKIIYSETAQENFAYSLIGNKWLWTSTPTSGNSNLYTQKNEPPTASFEIDGGLINQPVNLDASESYDPEGEDLLYVWTFNNSTTTISTSTPLIAHIFATLGNQIIILQVKDDQDQTDSLSKEMYITNQVDDTGYISNDLPVDLIITELLPNPAGSDTDLEWIEIFNAGPAPVDLANWQLDDAEKGSRPYTITDTYILNPGEYLVFDRPTTGIALNNGYDSARLIDPQGNILDQVSYDEVIEDASYALDINYTWHWTYALTPGEHNIVDITTVPAVSENKSNIKIPIHTKIADIRQYDFGDLLTTQGQVIVEPGTLGKNIFYINGIQIYCYKKDFPGLVIGDLIEITGTLSESRGETRLKMQGKEDIKFLLAQAPSLPQEFSIEDIDENIEGLLIQIQGELTEIKSSSWWLDDFTQEIKVYIKQSSGIKKGDIKVGDTLKITGIVSQFDEEYRILPRWPKDVEIIKKVKGAAISKDTIKDSQNQSSNSQLLKYLLAVACAVILVLLSIIIEQKKKRTN